MTAQYRPYRDIEGYEADNPTEGAGDIEIYERSGGGGPSHGPYSQYGSRSAHQTDERRQQRILVGCGLGCLTVILFTLLWWHSTHSSTAPTSASCDTHPWKIDAHNRVRASLATSLNASSIGNFIQEFSMTPHMAGTEQDNELANKIERIFRKFGLTDVHSKFYKVLLSLPPQSSTQNKVLVVDVDGVEWFNSATTNKFTGFSYYSPSADIVGEPMFVNYGRPIDYLQLQELFNRSDNIFKDKILIAKQYHLSSSEQYKYATFMQAAGLVLFPDPADYSGQAETDKRDHRDYPESFWLPADAVRSDSIFWNGAGDPETFEVPSVPFAYRDDSKFRFETGIPAQPISAQTAAEIFRQIRGKTAPADWVGGLNATYKTGPSMLNNRKVKLSVHNELQHKQVRNVFGSIPGDIEPDRYVIVGHQRDCSSTGAFTSGSGTGTLLELARVLGTLYQSGQWRPRRTIMFASWGAEEFNLIGSTEWVQDMEKILDARAIAYIDVNQLVTFDADTLKVIASPVLYNVIFNVTQQVPMVMGAIETVYDRWLKTQSLTRDSSNLVLNLDTVPEFLRKLPKSRQELVENSLADRILEKNLHSAYQVERPQVSNPDTLGSYSSFVTMAGIPVVSLRMIHSHPKHQHHHSSFYPLQGTQYDQFLALEKFIDPGFVKHHTMAQLIGRIILSLSDLPFLPINLFDYAQQLNDFHIKSLQMHNNFLKEHYETEQQSDTFSSLMDLLSNAITNFTKAAIEFHSRQDRIDTRQALPVRVMNDQLMRVERHFLDFRGIPSNNLKRHIVLSPADTFSTFEAFDSEGLFPALIDEMSELYVFKKNANETFTTLQKHLPILIHSIQSAADSLEQP